LTGKESIQDLYVKAAENNKTAEKELFEILYASFGLILQYKRVNSQDAEDIIQDAMIVIGEALKSANGMERFSAWSYTVLKNKWLDHIKSRKYQKNQPPLELNDNFPSEKGDKDFILIERLIDCFRKVGKTNRRQARILNLHFLGYKTDEICSRMKISRTNMYSILSRARSLMELCLDKGKI